MLDSEFYLIILSVNIDMSNFMQLFRASACEKIRKKYAFRVTHW